MLKKKKKALSSHEDWDPDWQRLWVSVGVARATESVVAKAARVPLLLFFSPKRGSVGQQIPLGTQLCCPGRWGKRGKFFLQFSM